LAKWLGTFTQELNTVRLCMQFCFRAKSGFCKRTDCLEIKRNQMILRVLKNKIAIFDLVVVQNLFFMADAIK